MPLNSPRMVFIDLLRGCAVLVMIEAHVVNAFLIPDSVNAKWFSVLDFFNGLAAPLFLFVAGFVFAAASKRKLEHFRKFDSVLWKQVGRIALIWTLGYALHFPSVPLQKVFTPESQTEWMRFLQADVLHCIAASISFLLALRLIINRDTFLERLLWLVALVPVLAAPIMWNVDFTGRVPEFVGSYLNGRHFSRFPLFPWAGFVFCGCIVGIRFLKAQSLDAIPRFMNSLLWWGLGSTLVALIMKSFLPALSDAGDTNAEPAFFLLRLGIVLMLVNVCWHIVEWSPSFVKDVGRESLLVYAAHLLIIYGAVWNGRSLAGIYDGQFSFLSCVVVSLILGVLMIASARMWRRLKIQSMPAARIVQYSGVVAAFVFVLMR